MMVRSYKAYLAFLHDCVAAGLSVALAMVLRVGPEEFPAFAPALWQAIPIYMVIAGSSFLLLGMYRGVWRYASITDLTAIVKAVTLSLVLFVPAMFLVDRLDGIPRAVPLIQWLLLLPMLGGPRLAYRLMKDQGRLPRALTGPPAVPVLVVGTGNQASLFIRAMHISSHPPYQVVGLLDVKAGRVGRRIHDVPVLANVGGLEAVTAGLAAKGIRVQRLILTGDGPRVPTDLPDRARRLGLSVSRLPSMTELQAAGTPEDYQRIRPIQLEDLLLRPQVPMDADAVAALVRGRRVLVTGAGGTIGRELSLQIAAFGPAALTLMENSEFALYGIELDLSEQAAEDGCQPLIWPRLCDVRDREAVTRLFSETGPELVFHAAALKHVPIVERDPLAGIATNVLGTRNVAHAARAAGVRAVIQISTDKAVNPTSVMGATKRLAEGYCQALDLEPVGDRPTRFLTVRFGNVLGSSGSVVPLFQRQLARGGPLTVTHPDMTRFFMTVQEAVALVLTAAAHGLEGREDRGAIFVLDMGKPIRIVDLARQVIRLANLDPDRDVSIVYTGLRPGEKLFEELFDRSETPLETDTAGVLAARPAPQPLARYEAALDQLAACVAAGDAKAARSLLAETVPGYPAATGPGVASLRGDVVSLTAVRERTATGRSGT